MKDALIIFFHHCVWLTIEAHVWDNCIDIKPPYYVKLETSIKVEQKDRAHLGNVRCKQEGMRTVGGDQIVINSCRIRRTYVGKNVRVCTHIDLHLPKA